MNKWMPRGTPSRREFLSSTASAVTMLIPGTTSGGDGFDIFLDKVEALEKRLGIYDLTQFTPE